MRDAGVPRERISMADGRASTRIGMAPSRGCAWALSTTPVPGLITERALSDRGRISVTIKSSAHQTRIRAVQTPPAAATVPRRGGLMRSV